MGQTGPLKKDRRTRDRDNVKREQIVHDGQVRGPELPADVEWHPAVARWWDAYRASPMAQYVVDDSQWQTLLAGVLLYNDAWLGGPRGRATRIAEFRMFFTSYFITPGDLRRNDLEVVYPSDDVDVDDLPQAVTSLAERRVRLANG